MAKYKPMRIGDTHPEQQINPATEEIDGKIYVSQTGVVLGRSSAGDGGHEEILFADLPGGGGAASIVEITYANMATAIADSTLTPGQYYNITDAAGTDLGFVCLAVKENEITVSGTGGYLNADFQAVGDYSGVEAATGQAAGTQQGIWTADNEGGYTQGDIVIWNLLHWQLTDGGVIDGTDPVTNTAAYTQLVKTDANQGYIEAWDGSEFDFPNAWLQYRADDRGNQLRHEHLFDVNQSELGYSALLDFQWGNNIWVNNISNNGIILQKNDPGTVSFNFLYPLAYIGSNSISAGCSVYQNIMLAGTQISGNTLTNAGEIVINFLFSGAQIYGNTINGASIGRNTLNVAALILTNNFGVGGIVENNILENSATLVDITAGASCQISRNKIGQGATLGGSSTMGDGCFITDNLCGSSSLINEFTLSEGGSIAFNALNASSFISGVNMSGTYATISQNIFLPGSGIFQCEMANNSVIANNQFNVNAELAGKTFAEGASLENSTWGFAEEDTETIVTNISTKRGYSSFSNYETTIDATGLTTIDALAVNYYKGILNITSDNATESIDQIDNPPTLFPFQIRPAAGLVLTVTGTAYSGIAAGQIALTTTDVTLDGDKGEFIELEIDPLGSGALIERRRVAGLL